MFVKLVSVAGMVMTPPTSPCSNATTAVSATSSSSSSSSSRHGNNHSVPQQPVLPVVPSATAAALSKAQSTHSWRPEEAARLADQAWQDSLLSPAGLAPTPPESTPSSVAGSATADANLWDFVDPTTKSSCICAKYVFWNLNIYYYYNCYYCYYYYYYYYYYYFFFFVDSFSFYEHTPK